jgi:hypothetical protein
MEVLVLWISKEASSNAKWRCSSRLFKENHLELHKTG